MGGMHLEGVLAVAGGVAALRALLAGSPAPWQHLPRSPCVLVVV